MDAVAAGAAADGDDPVAGLDMLPGHASGQDADGPAEDQRIGQVAGIHREGPVHRRDPHAVAVVAHAGDDPLQHAFRVKDAGGSRSGSRSGEATQKTSVLQIGFAPSPVPSASRITPPSPVFEPP